MRPEVRYLTLSAVLLLLGVNVVRAQPSDDCVCTLEYNPVCGSDGNTYGNKCAADCVNVTVAHDGECDPGCACIALYKPVCGTDGKTYGNSCEAGCANVAVDYDGECACPCTKELRPVCGQDGNTYGNPCMMRCAKTELAYEGECSTGCMCTEQYAPVCGKDGKTYSSKCAAGCANVEVDFVGECAPLVVRNTCCDESLIDPVCGRDDITYVNYKCATCAGVKVNYGRPCGARKAACRTCAAFTEIFDPICLVDGTLQKPWTYGNPCYAGCYGKATETSLYYKGACRPNCDAQCASAPGGRVCCGGVEYPNSCYASCAGGLAADQVSQCYSGLCTGDDAIQLMSGCPLGGRMAKCSNTCEEGVPCSTAPEVECVVTSCDRFFRFKPLTICQAAYVNRTVGKLLRC